MAHGHVVHWNHAYISETLYLQMTTQIVIFIIHVLQQLDMDEQKTSSVLYNGFFEEGKFCNFTVLPALLLLTIPGISNCSMLYKFFKRNFS